MFEVPAVLAERARRHLGAAGRTWAEQLPDIISAAQPSWSLAPGAVAGRYPDRAPGGSARRVEPARALGGVTPRGERARAGVFAGVAGSWCSQARAAGTGMR